MLVQRDAVIAGILIVFGGSIALGSTVRAFEAVTGTQLSEAWRISFGIAGAVALVVLTERIAPLFLRLRKPQPMEDVEIID